MKSIIHRFKVHLLSCVVVAMLIPLMLTTGVAQATSWNVIPGPNPGASGNELKAVAMVASNDVWAVGDSTAGNGASQMLTEHWNGTAWSVVASPNSGKSTNVLNDVKATSANDVWAVGQFSKAGGFRQTLTEHWNGTTWSVVASPNPSSTLNFLNGTVADPHSGQTWAVGVFFNASSLTQTLTELHP